MALKKFKPSTPSQRDLVLVDHSDLYKGRPEKTLCSGSKRSSGRDTFGHISSRHRGGGHKRLYRQIDFKRTKWNVKAKVERIEYDPNRTAHIALLRYEDDTLCYIIAPQRLSVGDTIIAGEKTDTKPGNAMPLKNIPVGTILHNVEIKPGKGGQLARSAGSYVQLTGKDSGYALLRLRSGEVRKVPSDCMATVGVVSNSDHQNRTIGKAGRSRWLGKRPQSRGVAMNPVDHPLGGGEGKTSGGRHPTSPWGWLTKGRHTRKNKSTDKFIVRSRHKK